MLGTSWSQGNLGGLRAVTDIMQSIWWGSEREIASAEGMAMFRERWRTNRSGTVLCRAR